MTNDQRNDLETAAMDYAVASQVAQQELGGPRWTQAESFRTSKWNHLQSLLDEIQEEYEALAEKAWMYEKEGQWVETELGP
jgi:hypothetical protein